GGGVRGSVALVGAFVYSHSRGKNNYLAVVNFCRSSGSIPSFRATSKALSRLSGSIRNLRRLSEIRSRIILSVSSGALCIKVCKCWWLIRGEVRVCRSRSRQRNLTANPLSCWYTSPHPPDASGKTVFSHCEACSPDDPPPERA